MNNGKLYFVNKLTGNKKLARLGNSGNEKNATHQSLFNVLNFSNCYIAYDIKFCNPDPIEYVKILIDDDKLVWKGELNPGGSLPIFGTFDSGYPIILNRNKRQAYIKIHERFPIQHSVEVKYKHIHDEDMLLLKENILGLDLIDDRGDTRKLHFSDNEIKLISN